MKPVYFVEYDAVWKMSHKRAMQFITAIITGEGATEADFYGKRVRKNTHYVDTLGYESDHPHVVDWCILRGYPCFHMTDFTMRDWRGALVSLQTGQEFELSGEF